MKRIISIAVLALLALPALAQSNDFGNDVDRRPRKSHAGIPWIQDLVWNERIKPISHDSTTRTMVQYLKGKTDWYIRDSSYVIRTGARLEVVDSEFVIDYDFRGDPYRRNLGEIIFLTLPDLVAYVEIFVDMDAYSVKVNREPKPQGSAYDGMDSKIVGNDPNIDQMTLGEILYKYVQTPARPATEMER